jgi:hypothetical protein
MYTGTLIRDLMATVERAEREVRRRQMPDVVELERLYELQIPLRQGDEVFVGAA